MKQFDVDGTRTGRPKPLIASLSAVQRAPSRFGIFELAVAVAVVVAVLGSVIMSNSKPEHKAASKRMNPIMEAPAPAGETLKGAVLAMLGRVGALSEIGPRAGTSLKERKRRPPGYLKTIKSKGYEPKLAVAGQMFTAQQAAAELNVSRPYVVELVNKGTFKGVEFTGGGHRRIPAIEVQRARTDMQSGMRKGIDAIDKLTEGASKREREDATRNATRRWRTLSR